jgi:hypothetical protein
VQVLETALKEDKAGSARSPDRGIPVKRATPVPGIRVQEFGYLLAQLRDLFHGRIPQNLPVQIEVGVYNPVTHSYHLLPWDAGVPLFQFRRQVVDGFPYDSQVMQDCRRQDLIAEEGGFGVVAVIASILSAAAGMSFKKEASCRIDDSGLFEDVRAYPRFEAALRHQIDLAPDQSFQVRTQRLELEQANPHAGVEVHHHVDVATGPHLAAHG